MTTGDEESKTVEASTPQQKQSSGGSSGTEFEPPLACVRRMLKNTLPANTNVGKDACAAFSRACGIFIVYLTACANDFARESKRQTITANDILAAVKEVDFEEFSPQLTAFIEQHRKNEKKKKERKKSEDLAKAKAPKHDRDEDQTPGDGEDDDESVPPAKKRKKVDIEKEIEGGGSENPGDMDEGETIDDAESLADASHQEDDADSQANAEQDEQSNANDDSNDEDE
mmetsp:Transcript_19599/g.28936  ORF Transcript_19599/g.28936 Transcript_19599/m.28936 type:complete len:228 (+) Transcript_19599:98-781(+)